MPKQRELHLVYIFFREAFFILIKTRKEPNGNILHANVLVGALLDIIGGFIAGTKGFPKLIMVVSVLSLFGALVLLPIRRHVIK